MPDFDNYNKQVKKKYEDAFKEVCNDLMKKRYDNWIIEDEFIFHKEFPRWHKKPEIFTAFDYTGKLDISNCGYSHPTHGDMPIKNFFENMHIDGVHGYGECDECELDIQKLTNTPYNKLLEVLHPIWIDKNIPLLEKTDELKKAFDKFLYGGSIEKTIKDKSDQEATKSILPAPEGTKWEEIEIKITKEARISLTVKRKERTYGLDKFVEQIKLPDYLKELFLEILNSPAGVIEEQGRKNFKQDISKLRKTLKDAFGITDNPIPSHETKTYKAKFLTQSDLEKYSSTNNDLSS